MAIMSKRDRATAAYRQACAWDLLDPETPGPGQLSDDNPYLATFAVAIVEYAEELFEVKEGMTLTWSA